MSNIFEYKDVTIFHPGYYIAEVIEEMGMSQYEFAMRMGTTPKTLSNLVNGLCSISNDLAKKLSMMLGTDVDVWLNLQKTFDKQIIEIEKKEEFRQQQEITEMLDYSFFVETVGIQEIEDVDSRTELLCKCFSVSDLRVLENMDFLVSLPHGMKRENKVLSNAWIQSALKIASDMSVSKYSSSKLKRAISKMEISVPKLSECGVAFVSLPGLAGSQIRSIVKWINADKVMVAVNTDVTKTEEELKLLEEEILRHRLKQPYISYINL